MIIGKPITALSGGGLKPEIVVTTKAGALLHLYMKDSSIILQSYQLGAYETTHTFIVNVNQTSYVIYDVTNNKRVEVLVDNVEQYRILLSMRYLYERGDKHNEITGDWSVKMNVPSSQSVSFDANYIEAIERNINYIWICPNNKIDVTGFSKAKIEFYVAETESYQGVFYNNVLLSVGQTSLEDNPTQNDMSFSVVGGTHTLSVDISSLTGNQYVVTRVTGMGVIRIYRIWLEV